MDLVFGRTFLRTVWARISGVEAAGLAKNASNAEGNENVQTQHGAHTSTPSLLVVDEIINTRFLLVLNAFISTVLDHLNTNCDHFSFFYVCINES